MTGKHTTGSGTSSEPRYLLLGEVLRPHGLNGEVRIRVLTDYPERIPQLEQLYVADSIHAANPVAYQVEHMRMHKQYGLLKLKGINNRNQADLLRQLSIMVAIDDAVPLEDGEFYLYQLIGLSVQTDTGETLGEITDWLETGANDVYIVKSPQYGEVLIPVTEETIVAYDFDQRVVIVKLPAGLLPE